jgi:hypothetical protein
MIPRSKKAAIELSIGTIVIVAIGTTLLILGLILVTNIFTSASGTVDLIDKNTKAQINRLFNENDEKTVIYLPGRQADIEKGQKGRIEFGIKNIVRGTSTAGSFTYQVRASEVQQGCSGLTLQKADSFIATGRSGKPVSILPGDTIERDIIMEVSEDSPLCIVKYDVIVKKDGQDYETNFFNLDIQA